VNRTQRPISWRDAAEAVETHTKKRSVAHPSGIIHEERRFFFRIFSGTISYSIRIDPARSVPMDLKKLEANWDELGKINPMEAILAQGEKKNKFWDPKEFFATGEREIDDALETLKASGVVLKQNKALDFGCGIGRLSQALARHFEAVEGIDIAPTMISLANQYNRFQGKCRYRVHQQDNLALFADNSFNFIYCVLTLQHMQPKYAKAYIREFCRVLAPGGAMIFQIPSAPVLFQSNGLINPGGFFLWFFPKWLLDATYRKIRYGNQPRAESYWIKKQEIVSLVQRNGLQVQSVQQTRGPVLYNCRYIAIKA
jgi:ubiquinone/menaquinone biosynthesis C-methylase UbiE